MFDSDLVAFYEMETKTVKTTRETKYSRFCESFN